MKESFDIIYKIFSAWKRDVSIWATSLLFVLAEMSYIFNKIKNSDGQITWTSIDIFFMIMIVVIFLFLIGSILYMRVHYPKSHSELGILVCIVNANTDQYKAIKDRFVQPFETMAQGYDDEIEIVCLDDYHSERLERIIKANARAGKENETADFFKKRKCFAGLIINCTPAGDGEDIFCTLTIEPGMIIPESTQAGEEATKTRTKRNMPFPELSKIKIYRKKESPDFEMCARNLNCIFQFSLASIFMSRGSYEEACRLFEQLYQELRTYNKQAPTIQKIKSIVPQRISYCCSQIARNEYDQYKKMLIVERIYQPERLIKAAAYLKHPLCIQDNRLEDAMLRVICVFLLEHNPEKSLEELMLTKHNHPIVKLNSVFLRVYMSGEAKTLVSAYRDYKCLGKLDGKSLMEAEEFICQEYESDKTKFQLLFLLFMLYDHRNEAVLAKEALLKLCKDERLPTDAKLASILQLFRKKYMIDSDNADKKSA